MEHGRTHGATSSLSVGSFAHFLESGMVKLSKNAAGFMHHPKDRYDLTPTTVQTALAGLGVPRMLTNSHPPPMSFYLGW